MSVRGRAHPTLRLAVAVVPVRNEQSRLGRCLDALSRAVRTARAAGLEAHVVVALDDCRDGSAALCAGRPDVRTVEGAWRTAGGARAAGCAEAMRLAVRGGFALDTVWLASTDADSVVPFDWLAHHARLADRGWDAVRGTVFVTDWSGWPPDTPAAYAAGYRHDDHHDHVHGANLGVRASAYRRAGGYPSMAAHEDHALVGALNRTGAAVTATSRAGVRTSARPHGRAPDGFARHLRDLAAHRPAADTLPNALGETT